MIYQSYNGGWLDGGGWRKPVGMLGLRSQHPNYPNYPNSPWVYYDFAKIPQDVMSNMPDLCSKSVFIRMISTEMTIRDI